MGAGPIPIRAVWDWLDREGIFDSELREFLETILMEIDARVCARMRKENEAKRPAKEPQATPNRPPPKKRRR